MKVGPKKCALLKGSTSSTDYRGDTNSTFVASVLQLVDNNSRRRAFARNVELFYRLDSDRVDLFVVSYALPTLATAEALYYILLV